MTSSPPSVHRRQIDTTPVANGSSTTSSSTTRTPWSCETNWTVTRGSLESAVTFESFDFPIDSESTGPKPPLLLVPQSPSDCEPCEITLKFSEKQEIRQVYVRSTGRNYEIYYATHPQSENEYLCTVRCSAVEADVANTVSVTEKGKVNNEDDWVEINHDYQNYYEATAEINDSEPCTSLTLRLLSLQSKAFVYIEEIYVFADCIGTYDSDSQIQIANPEASFMTMLVPTLLGLSKSTSLPKSIQKPVQIESPPKPDAELTRSQVASELTRCNVASSTSDTQIAKTSHDPNTAVLEQLVSRVSRVEDILLRFEQKMLIPITNIEARLQHLEQQVELLSKNPPTSHPNPQHTNQSEEQEEQHSTKELQEPKKYVSIDEALAAALVGFSSNQSSEQGCLASESPEPTSPHQQNNKVTKSLTNHPQDLTTTLYDASNSEITNGDNNNDNDNNNNDNDDKNEDEIVIQSSSLDKNDILKYYPDQCPDVKTGSECGVDFETCILEVKFDACLDNGDVEAFLSCTDDNHNRTDVLVEETSPNENENENTLLVELDGEDVLQVHPDRHLETSFDSLI